MHQFARYENGHLRRCYERSAEEMLVEKLTNWQRHQWLRAGRPMDADSLRRFGRLMGRSCGLGKLWIQPKTRRIDGTLPAREFPRQCESWSPMSRGRRSDYRIYG